MKLRAGCMVVGFLSLVVSTVAQTSGSSPASAQLPPPLIQFSNVATDEGGNALSGVVSITFSLYSGQRGGEALWTETQNNVQLDPTGHFSAQLGITKPNGVPTTLFTTGEARWLGVQVAEQTEQPRMLLVSAPYALKAGDATTLGGLPPSAFVRTEASAAMSGTAAATAAANQGVALPPLGGTGTTNYIPRWTSTTTIGNSVMFQSDGNVGVGTKNPGARVTAVSAGVAVRGSSSGGAGIGVFGNATSPSGNGTGVYGQTASPGAAGVFGVANVGGAGLIPTGVYGLSSDPNGDAVGGAAIATSGFATGVIGASASSGGTGTAGFATATSGLTYGATGSASSPSGIGVFGQNSASTGGTGITGVSYATTGNSTGVSGQSNSLNGIGVYGTAPSTTGYTTGVLGLDSSPAGTGVVGENNSTGGTGLVGLATNATGGIGVIGATDSTNGEAGIFSANTGQGLILQGLSGSTHSQVFSVDAAGNLDITGNLTVSGSKSARVKTQDGREVALYAVESPENWFEDFGTGRLQGGAAEVSLDQGFLQTVDAALDYHVFLTPNGDCRGLYVARKSPGEFLVRELGGGNASVAFDYRIVARRRGFEKVRLQEVHLPQVSQDVKARFAHQEWVRPLTVPAPPLPLVPKIATPVLPPL